MRFLFYKIYFQLFVRKHQSVTASNIRSGEKQEPCNVDKVGNTTLTPKHPNSVTSSSYSLPFPGLHSVREPAEVVLNTTPHSRVSIGQEVTKGINSGVAGTVCHSRIINTTSVPNNPIVHQSNPESLSLEKVKSTNVHLDKGGENPSLLTKGASSSLVSTRTGKVLPERRNKAPYSKSQFKWSKDGIVSKESSLDGSRGSLSDSELCYKDSSHRKSVSLQLSKNSSSMLMTPAFSMAVKGVLPSMNSSYSWSRSSSSKQIKKDRTLRPLLVKDSPKSRMLRNTKLRWSKTIGKHKHKILNPYHLVKCKKNLPLVGEKQSTSTKLLQKKSKYKLVKPRDQFQVSKLIICIYKLIIIKIILIFTFIFGLIMKFELKKISSY